MVLLLDRGRAVAAIAEDLGLNEATVYHYAQTYRLKGLDSYLKAEQPGYCGLLTSAQLAGLTRSWAGPSTPIAGPLPTDWLPVTGCVTPFRA